MLVISTYLVVSLAVPREVVSYTNYQEVGDTSSHLLLSQSYRPDQAQHRVEPSLATRSTLCRE